MEPEASTDVTSEGSMIENDLVYIDLRYKGKFHETATKPELSIDLNLLTGVPEN